MNSDESEYRNHQREAAQAQEELYRVEKGLRWGTITPPVAEGNMIGVKRGDQRWTLLVQEVWPGEEDGVFGVRGIIGLKRESGSHEPIR